MNSTYLVIEIAANRIVGKFTSYLRAMAYVGSLEVRRGTIGAWRVY
jgi:hypothetical protein